MNGDDSNHAGERRKAPSAAAVEAGFAERVLTAAWRNKVPDRWIFPLFLFFAFLSLAVPLGSLLYFGGGRGSYLFLIGGMGAGHILLVTYLILFYIWMVATQRTQFRIRTPSELQVRLASLVPPLYASGALLVAAATIMAVGEHAMRAVGGNRNSGALTVYCPVVFVAGLLNMALASQTRNRSASRALTAVMLLVNAQLAGFAYFFVWKNRYFIANSKEYFADKEYELLAGKSFPPEPLTFCHALRTLPSGICVLIPIATFCVLFRCFFHVSLIETTHKGTKFDTKRRSWHLGILGMLTLVISFVVIGLSSRLVIMTTTYHYQSFASTSLGTLLTATGLVATSTLRKASPAFSPTFKTVTMLLAALILVVAYRAVDEAEEFYQKSIDSHNSLIRGPAVMIPCGKTTNATTIVPEGQVCFRLYNEITEAKERHYWNKKRARDDDQIDESEDDTANEDTLLCISKEKICDGVVDVVDPVKKCSGSVWSTVRAFADELDCLGGGGAWSTLSSLKLAVAASMALVLAIFVKLAFFGDGTEDDEDDLLSEEEGGEDCAAANGDGHGGMSSIKDRIRSAVSERFTAVKEAGGKEDAAGAC